MLTSHTHSVCEIASTSTRRSEIQTIVSVSPLMSEISVERISNGFKTMIRLSLPFSQARRCSPPELMRSMSAISYWCVISAQSSNTNRSSVVELASTMVRTSLRSLISPERPMTSVMRYGTVERISPSQKKRKKKLSKILTHFMTAPLQRSSGNHENRRSSSSSMQAGKSE